MTELSGGVPTGNLLTPWGTITFEPAAGGSQAQVSLNNVPSRECIRISNALMGDEYRTVTVNGATVKAEGRELDLTTAGTQCNSSNANTLGFTFGRA